MADDHAPTEIDTTKPSIARCYDAVLGGKDNFEVDRALVEQYLRILPEVRSLAVANRAWLTRVVRFLTEQAGIDQFLDVGAGLPTRDNTHQVAQRSNPAARVVYVDDDPACQAFGRALLEEDERTRFVDGDLTEPAELLRHPGITGHLDWNRPVGLIQCATLHHVTDARGPQQIMAGYVDALPAGSYLALTHFYDPEDDGGYFSGKARDLQQLGQDSGMNSGFWRTRAEIAAYFGGLELVEPGLALLQDWRPDADTPAGDDSDQLFLGGVGRKP